LHREDFWGEDLTKISGLEKAVIANLESIEAIGIKNHIHELGKN